MTVMMRCVLVLTAALFVTGSRAVAQSNPCGVLTSAEAVAHIARGKKTYNEEPEATTLRGGAVCDYPFGGQIGLWNSASDLEAFLKNFRSDKFPRHPAADISAGAWIMYPVPESQYKDRVAFLAAPVGQKVVTVVLHAHNGAADGPMGQVCKDPSRLKPDEREDCKKIMADKSETQESLKPALVKLAKVVVAKVRSGK